MTTSDSRLRRTGPSAPSTAEISVLIAAHRAGGTIGRAVESALSQPEVRQVVVVDDASPDDTQAAARAADDGSGRLEIVPLARNRGPAGARNVALDAARFPLIAILDADDTFLHGRFAHLSHGDDWDVFVDNVVFLSGLDQAVPSGAPAGFEPLTLEAFVRGNISKRGVLRGELGFMKPVIRRHFLDRHSIRYDETLRLGEDFDLYARCFLAGARCLTSRQAGYAAIVRPDSLSASHSTADLRAFAQAARRLTRDPKANPSERAALLQHARQIEARHALRDFLERKQTDGIVKATLQASARPVTLAGILQGVAADKIAPFRTKVKSDRPRTLFPMQDLQGRSR